MDGYPFGEGRLKERTNQVAKAVRERGSHVRERGAGCAVAAGNGEGRSSF
jgi:hypothetical protein